MILDYAESTGAFCLYVNRGDADLRALVEGYGMDYSRPASTPERAVVFTREPYAAVNFIKHANDRARTKLQGLYGEIQSSRALTSNFKTTYPDTEEFARIIGSPYSFQGAFVEYCMRRNGALGGDEPGVGKTGEAILLANEMKAKRVLVICPASIRLQWMDCARLWSTMPGRPIMYPIMKSSDGVHPTANWTFVSFGLACSRGIYDALRKGKFDLIIIDEIHFLKSSEALRTKHIFGGTIWHKDPEDPNDWSKRTAELLGGLTENCGYVLGLSGTPLPNRPKECYTLAKNICWDSIDWQTETEFRNKYNPAVYNGQYKREEAGRLSELNARLRANFMIRRGLDEVMPQLPKASHQVQHIEINGAIRKALEAERMLDIDPHELDGLSASVDGPISTVRMMMGLAMAPGVAQYVEMLLGSGVDKIFLSGWHKEVLDIWENKLHKWGVARVDGSTPDGQKNLAKLDFINNPKMGVFLANYMSGGVGTDGLQHVCHRAVLGEVSWVSGENEQTVRRLRRNGQELSVQADYMMVRGSFSERVLGSSLEKMQDIHEALDKEI
jgi:SWI/SNF-related matrix-associated actin-dependent regulator 1 of chromatin subfamily A